MDQLETRKDAVLTVIIDLVRHADSDWMASGVTDNNPPISDNGQDFARMLSRRWEDGSHHTDVWVSPTRRTQETAEIAYPYGRKQIMLWLEEQRAPVRWEGQSDHSLAEQDLDEWRNRQPDAMWLPPEGMEMFNSFADRVKRGLLEELEKKGCVPAEDPRLWHHSQAGQQDTVVLVFGHQGTNAVITSYLMGYPVVPWDTVRWDMCWTGVTRLQLTPVSGCFMWQLNKFNDMSHAG